MSFKQNQDCYPTVGQIERDISQKVNNLYHQEFTHRASKVKCHLFENKIFIFCEEVITPIEKLLLEASYLHLLHQVRRCLDSSLKVKIEELIEKIVRVKVKRCIYSTDIEINSTVIIIILAEPPQVRPKRISHRSRLKNVVNFNHSKDKLSELS